MRHNALYTILFSGAVCIACAVLVSSAAVSLKEDQLRNAALDKQRNVLFAAGLAQTGENLDASEVQRRFEGIRSVVIELQTGERTGIDPTGFDQAKAAKDPSTSRRSSGEPGLACAACPHHALVYEIMVEKERPGRQGGRCPSRAMGLWATLYGFLALGG